NEEWIGTPRGNQAPPGNRAPPVPGGSLIRIELGAYVGACERDRAVTACAEAPGAAVIFAPVDRLRGRLSGIRDPDGQIWRLAASA
ncbi:MAG: hypothetical protein AAF334_07115, partial [Pseudomonadota bacterium]